MSESNVDDHTTATAAATAVPPVPRLPGLPPLLDDAALHEVIGWRHHLHQYPELAFHETATSAFIEQALRSHGIEPAPRPAGLVSGVIARIDGARPGPHVALRADIDGLPVDERSAFPEPSRNAGRMHACGHDLHMASLLGAALALDRLRDRIAGSVTLVFQPAEEIGRGAHAVVDAGVLDDVDAIVGFHNNPDLPVGTVAVGPGALMAGCIRFRVTFHAEGTHAAHPESGTGPMEAVASLMLAAQTVVSRNVSPFHSAVLSITHIFGGDVWNVIPAEAGFEGTVRVFDDGDLHLMERRFRALAQGTADAFGIGVDVLWESPGADRPGEGGHPLVNDAPLAQAVADAVPAYARYDKPIPSMVGEDFAVYGRKARLVFALVGSNGSPHAPSVHSPEFLGYDGTVPYGVAYLTSAAFTVLRELAR